MPNKKFTLTTPLYYVNSKPHIGHSYTEIAADVLARFSRLAGKDVFFLTGTDEHGQKVAKAAEAAGQTPKDFTDRISQDFRDLWKTLRISEHEFIRTTEDRHAAAVQAVWLELDRRGRLYKAAYSGWYCTPDETFWAEGQVTHEGGKTLCPDCKRPVERLEEENFFLKMSDKKEWLIRKIREAEAIKILPDSRRNEVLGFLENNDLQDLCISRPKSRMSWGIASPLSGDHVTYVWFDALINYITACGYGDPAQKERLAQRWPADVHIIGKDILRHHAVYWPVILEALGLELPRRIFAHGWWTVNGEKMSKSRGNAVNPVDIVKNYGVDAYRYFILRETSFGSDGTFSVEALKLRFNTDLANGPGNLLQRTLTMCEKYFEGQLPKVEYPSPRETPQTHHRLRAAAAGLFKTLEPFMDGLKFSEALKEIWKVIRLADETIQSSSPWVLAKEGKTEELKIVIATLLETLRILAIVLWPFMPDTAEKMRLALGIAEPISEYRLEEDPWGYFKKGGTTHKGAALFPRVDLKKG